MLKANEVLSNFKIISEIYRESGHCEEISKYLKGRFEKAGFVVEVKKDGTICAYRGLNKNKNNAIILQAHMDMVAVSKDKNPKKPIKTHIKDGWLYANGRTLGADDGIGVAAMIAIADDAKFNNYPLEMLVTTDEETSMVGAKLLTKEDFYGKYLINLDSEELGVITKGCAGSVNYGLTEKVKTKVLTDSGYATIQIKLSGAKGGHSAEIDSKTLNPLKAVLSLLKDKDYKLVSVEGGDKFNSVPIEVTAQILVKSSEKLQIKTELDKYLKNIVQKNIGNNPELKYTIASGRANVGMKYLDEDTQRTLLIGIDSIPVRVFSAYDNGVNMTSQNLGVLKIEDGTCHIKVMGRSSEPTGKEGSALKEKTINALSEAFNKKISPTDENPIWSAKINSQLERNAVKAYAFIQKGKTPKIMIEHGGLEPAVFANEDVDLEQISIGPTLESPHSVKERLKLDTIIPFYNWLAKTIEITSINN